MRILIKFKLLKFVHFDLQILKNTTASRRGGGGGGDTNADGSL